MIMLAVTGPVGRRAVDIITQPALSAFGIDAHASRHAQMDHQGLAAVERHQYIFGAAAELLGHASVQPLGEAGRKGTAQILAPDMRFDDGAAFQRGQKTKSHGFDFGQFGHGFI